MAEVTAMRNNALPYPVYGAPFTVVLPMLDADGDLVTGATTPDSEISKNGDTFADCTNEATEIATNSGMYYLALTGTELTCDIAAVIAKSATSGMKTTPLVLYPRKLVTLRSGTSAGGDTAYITLDAAAGSIDDMWNGCLCVATIDTNVEARIITNYTGSNQRAAVTPAWNVAPDADDTFVIYLPESMQIPRVLLDASALSDAGALDDAGVRTAVGLATANLDTQLAPVASLAIKKNTALANFTFVMRDSTTNALATGLTVTCTRKIDAGAFGAGTLANVAEIGNGLYKVDFGAGDLNGSVVTLRCVAVGANDTFVTLLTTV